MARTEVLVKLIVRHEQLKQKHRRERIKALIAEQEQPKEQRAEHPSYRVSRRVILPTRK